VKVRFYSSYDRTFAHLSSEEQMRVSEAEETLIKFFKDRSIPVHGGMGLKKLKGDYWEIRIGLSIRILFSVHKGTLNFIIVGDHENIRRYLRRI